MRNKKRLTQIIAITSLTLLIGLGLANDGMPPLPGNGGRGTTQHEWVVSVSGFLPGDGAAAGAFTVLATDRIAAQNEGRRVFLDRFPNAIVFSVSAIRRGNMFIDPTI